MIGQLYAQRIHGNGGVYEEVVLQKHYLALRNTTDVRTWISTVYHANGSNERRYEISWSSFSIAEDSCDHSGNRPRRYSRSETSPLA